MAKRKTAIQRRQARENLVGLAQCAVFVVAFVVIAALTGGFAVY